jgi:rfaE bifunctional protein nucleotidyltransferase chain/domain
LGQIISQSDLILHRRNWKGNGETVVFVSGCFDLLHPGHIRLLEQARSYGDKLVVGVHSDAGVKASQARQGTHNGALPSGAERPITPYSERAEILAELAAVDYVVDFDEPYAASLIEALHPEFVVSGAPTEVQASPNESSASCTHDQAKMIRILREPGYSTEQLLSRIVQRPA